MTNTRATVRLPRETYAEAQELAAEEFDGNLSAVIRAAVQEYATDGRA